MKKLFLFIFIQFSNFAQESAHGELFIHLHNYSSPWNVTFTLTAVSARWDENFELTDYYESASHTLNSAVCSTCTISYFEHILHPGIYEEFAVGLYKISAIEGGSEQAHFYMDWRTSNWNSSLDVNFKYDEGTKEFKDHSSNQNIDHTYQTLWDLTDNILETEGLEDYWENCLAVFDNGEANPEFAWGPYPGFSNNYFKIYKKKGTQDFILYDSTTSTTYVDVNEEILYGPPQSNEGEVYYKITSLGYPTENPFIPPYESGFSNTVDIRILYSEMDKKSAVRQSYNGYLLSDNYPNPFNPSTIINFTIPKSAFVNLKVYDVLGNEVQTLINEAKDAGNYSLEFNAENLPSGIYLYKLQAGDFTQTKRMILVK